MANLAIRTPFSTANAISVHLMEVIALVFIFGL